MLYIPKPTSFTTNTKIPGTANCCATATQEQQARNLDVTPAACSTQRRRTCCKSVRTQRPLQHLLETSEDRPSVKKLKTRYSTLTLRMNFVLKPQVILHRAERKLVQESSTPTRAPASAKSLSRRMSLEVSGHPDTFRPNSRPSCPTYCTTPSPMAAVKEPNAEPPKAAVSHVL